MYKNIAISDVYVYIYIYMHVYMCIYIYIHTYILVCSQSIDKDSPKLTQDGFTTSRPGW